MKGFLTLLLLLGASEVHALEITAGQATSSSIQDGAVTPAKLASDADSLNKVTAGGASANSTEGTIAVESTTTFKSSVTLQGALGIGDGTDSFAIPFTIGASSFIFNSNNHIGVGISPNSFLVIDNVDDANTTGDPTVLGKVRIHSAANGETLATNRSGLEFKAASGGGGYGWKISPDASGGGAEVDLVIEARRGSATWSPMVTIENQGNVGIGDTTPDAKLDVTLALGERFKAGDDDIPKATVEFSTSTAMWKFDMVKLGDDVTHAFETQFGNTGMVLAHANGGESCQWSINASASAPILIADPYTLCAAADTDVKLALYADGDGTYTLKNRRGGVRFVAISFLGFE